jgi:hypothetical protein
VASPIPPLMVGAVLLAAVLHALWNAIAKGITDRLAAFTLIGLGSLFVVLVIPFVAHPAAASRPFIAISALLHVGYGMMLMLSYRGWRPRPGLSACPRNIAAAGHGGGCHHHP